MCTTITTKKKLKYFEKNFLINLVNRVFIFWYQSKYTGKKKMNLFKFYLF